MLLNKFFRCFDDVIRQRNPVEVGDHEPTLRDQHSTHFLCGLGTIEPMPALTGSDNLKAGSR